MGHLLDDVSHLDYEAFDLGNRLNGKCEELFAQRHDAVAQRFFQGDSQAQVADTGDRQILVQDRLTAALPYRHASWTFYTRLATTRASGSGWLPFRLP